jgi:hypothetical protein
MGLSLNTHSRRGSELETLIEVSICFDAKQSDEAVAFPLAKLKRHQLAYLVKHGRAGAISGILVGATHDCVGAYLWLDWKDIPAALSGGVKWESEAWVEAGRWGGMVEWARIVGGVK